MFVFSRTYCSLIAKRLAFHLRVSEGSERFCILMFLIIILRFLWSFKSDLELNMLELFILSQIRSCGGYFQKFGVSRFLCVLLF